MDRHAQPVPLKALCRQEGERFSLFKLSVTYREALNQLSAGKMQSVLEKRADGRIFADEASVLRYHLAAAHENLERDVRRLDQRITEAIDRQSD